MPPPKAKGGLQSERARKGDSQDSYCPLLRTIRGGSIPFSIRHRQIHETGRYVGAFASAHMVWGGTRLDDLFRTFRKLGCILTPSVDVYEEAGGVLWQLQVHHGYLLRQRSSLANDVRIVLLPVRLGELLSVRIDATFSPFR